MYIRRNSFVGDRFLLYRYSFLRIIFHACSVVVIFFVHILSYYELLLPVIRLVSRDLWVMGSTSSFFSSLRRAPFFFLIVYFVLSRIFFLIAVLLALLFLHCHFVCRVPM